MSDYVIYHLHSDLSNGVTNVDSVTKDWQYVNKAKECGMKALAFSEHGNVFGWVHKKDLIEAAGMKYIHAIEVYVTEKLFEYPDIPDEIYESLLGVDAEEAQKELEDYYELDKKKIRDNYHCVLIAKNYEGVKEINRLSSKSFNRDDGHFYYAPRITIDELVATSDNVMVTTACLASMLNRGTPEIKEKFINFLANNKDRCYLEIQHHNIDAQREYNKYLYTLSQAIGVPLIAGTDTHALNEEHMEGRNILQKSKNVHFEDEDAWDLKMYTTKEDLLDAYRLQNALPIDVVETAIDETVKMADRVEEFSLDKSYKYPDLWNEPEQLLRRKIKEGIIRRGVDKYPNYQDYLDRIEYEMVAFIHNGAINFILLMEDIIKFCRDSDIKIGWGRGSVNGSVVCWLLGITEMDSIKFNLSFDRFMNVERVSLSDIDTDFPPSRRDDVKKYIVNHHGLYCSDIITFNTIALKGAIRDVCRALYKDSEDDYMITTNYICDNVEQKENKMRQEYPDVFRYVDLVNGVIVSIGTHPCGMIVSPHPLDETIGLCTTSTDPYVVSQIYMKEIDSLNYVKLDLLALDTIELISETCKLAGIPMLSPDTLDVNDDNVWNSMREDTTQIFQWEGTTGADYIRKLLSDENIEKFKSINENVDKMSLITIGNSAIRPAGASYRDDLASGVVRKTGSKAIDDFLSSTFGYLVYQEQIIFFLHLYCGFTMGEADIVRRGFAKKTGTGQFIPRIKEGFIKTMTEQYGLSVEKAEKDIVAFLKVIEDASSYLFSLNHSEPYSYEGYASAWLRYYYPLEFITVALNINRDKEEKTAALTAYAKKVGIPIVSPVFRHSKAEYFCDKEEKVIYKGIGSVKFMNNNVADELYNLKDKCYNNFVKLMEDIKMHTSLNSKQLDILIKINFFKEFGDINKLLRCVEVFNELYGRKNLKKTKASKLGIPTEICLKYSEKETNTQFNNANMIAIINWLFDNNMSCKPVTDGEIISYQQELLGYISYTDPKKPWNYCCVTQLDTKYSPKFVAYCIQNGKSLDMKIHKQKPWKDKSCRVSWKDLPLQEGDIIYIASCKKEPRSKKVGDEWVKSDTEFDWWLKDYSLVYRR